MPYHSFPHYHLSRMKEYPRLMWSHSMGAFGASLATIFIPVYLVKELDFSIQGVLFWYGLFVTSAIPFLYLGAQMASRFGSKKEIALGHLLHASSYLSVALVSSSGEWLVWVAAVLLGATRGMYWPAYHAFFSKIKKSGRAGEQIGLATGLILLIHGVAPAIGGVAADAVGISFLYGAGVVILVISGIPILTGPEVTKKRPLNLKLLDLRRIKRDLLANAANSTNVVVDHLLWPLLVFLIVGSYSAVGLLSSVVLLASIATAIYVGRLEKTRGEKHFLKEGVMAIEASHFLRFIASTPPGVFVVNSVFGIANALKIPPFITRYYKMADQEPRMEYIFAFEIAFQLGQLAVVSLLLLASLFLSGETLLLLGVALIMPFGLMILKIR